MKILSGIAGALACALLLGAGAPGAINNALAGDTDGGIVLQIDPETEELDQVSETDDQASEEVGDDIGSTEELDQVSETDDQASEEVGADSETAEQASEVLPAAPEGEEYPLEEESPLQEEMPLGDREAEGRDLP